MEKERLESDRSQCQELSEHCRTPTEPAVILQGPVYRAAFLELGLGAWIEFGHTDMRGAAFLLEKIALLKMWRGHGCYVHRKPGATEFG